MLDKELLAHAVGFVKNNTSITIYELADGIHTDYDTAKEILEKLENCFLIVDFGGFYASTDLAELN